MRNLLILILFFVFGFSYSQQLNCTVTINTSKLANTNDQIFKTLEKSLSDYINKTDWTNLTSKNNERIDCSMYITVNEYNSGQFKATLQVQSSRPVYNSSYATPILNYNDNDFSFNYVEFENLTFNPNSFNSNLIAVISYYCYIIIGMDADTFALKGGTEYLTAAQDIANLGLQSGYKGWSQSDGNQNRYFLINDMLSNTFSPFREAMFQYHFEGLDLMNKDLKTAKEKVKSSIATLATLHKTRPNAFLTRVFFDAKSDEIVSIFSGGPNVPITDLQDDLNRISPLNAAKWTKIKF